MQNKADGKPAHILISKEGSATGVCAQVQNSDPLKTYFESKVSYTDTKKKQQQTISNAIAIGSSTSIY
ncbi:MAG: hypothetical protein PUB35_07300 [Campylobacteraceae bacterium]|nr:hypothetical protein [Campylobacteraceae bacterium]